MLGVFIAIAGIILVVSNPFSKSVPDNHPIREVVEQEAVSDTVDNSFEATKDRVTEVNENYGQNIKSSYAGNNSTMEAMAKQRMFFSGLKSTLIIILLIAAILLVIVKCFNISFKKKQTDTADAGETEISAEGRKSVRSAPENKAKPKTVVQKQKKDDKPKVVKKTTETKKESVATADEEDVADSCQLP
jgi:flagellar biosynthesis/type III secretory pathway M-ring protein FliF/YscJ